MPFFNSYGRPFVTYDPSNKQHREYFSQFMKTNTWGNSPVRFIIDNEESANFIATLKNQTLLYYMGKEFKG